MPDKNSSPVKAPIIPSLLTVKQAAQRLSVGLSTIYKFVDEKRLPYVDLGQEGYRRCLRFKPEDLDKFILDHSRQ